MKVTVEMEICLPAIPDRFPLRSLKSGASGEYLARLFLPGPEILIEDLTDDQVSEFCKSYVSAFREKVAERRRARELAETAAAPRRAGA